MLLLLGGVLRGPHTTCHALSNSKNVPRFTAFLASLPGHHSYCNAGPSCRPGWCSTLSSGFWRLQHVLCITPRCILLKRCFADATLFLGHLKNVYTLFRLLGSLTLQLHLVFSMPLSTTTLIPPGPLASPCMCLRSCRVCVFALLSHLLGRRPALIATKIVPVIQGLCRYCLCTRAGSVLPFLKDFGVLHRHSLFLTLEKITLCLTFLFT